MVARGLINASQVHLYTEGGVAFEIFLLLSGEVESLQVVHVCR
jgi:hypothetical protein